MWPTLFRIGDFEVSTFGLMMFLAFLVAGMLLTRQYRRYGLHDDLASSVVIAGLIGGILGAKIYYAILTQDFGSIFSRAGLVWYGGLIGGWLLATIVVLRAKADYFTAADASAPSLALGYGIGRIGCFLVGDDYGRPTDAWFGVAFPEGLPPTTAGALRDFGVAVDPTLPSDTLLRVHPTQIYETLAAFAIFGVLMAVSRRPHGRGLVFSLFLILGGIERFLVEIVRAKDDRFFGPFTVAQLISVILIVAGIWLAARSRRDRTIAEATAEGA
jgi:phosphatidylglycerol---prolipoprotein diacylglyceryl transferase